MKGISSLKRDRRKKKLIKIKKYQCGNEANDSHFVKQWKEGRKDVGRLPNHLTKTIQPVPHRYVVTATLKIYNIIE